MIYRGYGLKGVRPVRRPMGPGVKIGCACSRGGTLGAVVKDREKGKTLFLSNNHVLANCSDGSDGRARTGDLIFSPPVFCGGNSRNIIGKLYKWVPLKQDTPNVADAAVAEPVQNIDIYREIKGIGGITGISKGKPGMKIKKKGWATGLTEGEIVKDDYTVTITFEGKEYVFTDQLLADIRCREGDSGSVVLDSDNRVIGLLFAAVGSMGVINRIEHVVSQLDIEFV